jgi:lysozyme
MMLARLGRGRRRLVALSAAAVTVATYAEVAHAGQECAPATVVDGVDLNPDGDGTLDWSAAKASGTAFAIIKATQGNYYQDADFAANWAAMKAAGVRRGAYHFFDGTVTGAEQASYFLSVMGSLEPGDLPPTLDIECPTGEADCEGNGTSGAASAAKLTQAMNDFLTAVHTATGVMPIVYSYGSWFSDNGIDTTGLEAYPLWIADISGTNCFTVPSPWSSATIWQHDFDGGVGSVNADQDYFLGTAAQLAAFSMGGHGFDAGAPMDAGEYGMCSDMGVDGDCIETSMCTAMGGTPTPDLCPGPADIQCCTGLPHHSSSGASSGHSSASSGVEPSSSGGTTTGGTTSAPTTGAATSVATTTGAATSSGSFSQGDAGATSGVSTGGGGFRDGGGSDESAAGSGSAGCGCSVVRRERGFGAGGVVAVLGGLLVAVRRRSGRRTRARR